jgi:hypothetical protein
LWSGEIASFHQRSLFLRKLIRGHSWNLNSRVKREPVLGLLLSSMTILPMNSKSGVSK